MASSVEVLNVGTRESQLAMVQTKHIVEHLRKSHSNVEFNIIGISTKGDKVLDKPLAKIGDKGLFTKELEVALADGRVDLVVHSLKDLPSSMPEGMLIGCIFKREDRRDALVMSQQNVDAGIKSLQDLPEGSIVGTSSLRRIAQLSLMAHGRFRCDDVRGNLNTRLRKLDADDGRYDALVLAAAGMERLGWHDRVTARFAPEEMLYATGQGALAIEVRQADTTVLPLVEALMDRTTLLECLAERSFLKTLGGGCSVPIGVSCQVASHGNGKESLTMTGTVFSLDGSRSVADTRTAEWSAESGGGDETLRAVITGVHVPGKWQHAANQVAALGERIANSLLERNAGPLLEEARSAIAASVANP
ncbi:porphobilinogen deaminase-like [Sycon ciliatum]|uniref:porphobilinogen deaminase-like n=1 Tax=Sycon ciliatum TaxID=27933 RepID=UPI0020AE1E56|eukprot:scpid63377/ scgid11083/ Porphobilinogen deaminase; Hydroxymethylbilane synthase; Pre-uroporphyrinogen synthase